MHAPRLIAASILAADFGNLAQEIQAAESGGADWIHLDVMDGHFVPNLTMGPVIAKACRAATSLPLDIHMMVEAPDGLLEAFAAAGADRIIVHVEACPNLHRTLLNIHALGLKAGAAINPATPAIAVSEVLTLADQILVMTVNPGYAGQAFLSHTLSKVSTLRDWVAGLPEPPLLEVDGGIGPDTARQAAEAGANVFVAATSIFGYRDGIQAGIRGLQQAIGVIPVG
jgi:ribulose-phosphate 3-epimerase